MGKRQSDANDMDPFVPTRKRRKVIHEAPTSEQVTTSHQLRQILVFTQDLRQARHGLQSFKLFLDCWNSEAGPRSDQVRLLKEFLQTVRPRDASEDAVYFPDIMETWHFAAQTHDEGVLSSVVVALGLLLQIVSASLELVPHGLGLCHTLLQERRLKLLARNLSSDKNKGFIISPTLRLLREVVAFDGGVVARRVFRARADTLASLARNLEVRYPGDDPDDRSRSSVRTNAVRLLLACLRYLPADARRELLAEKHLVSHLTYMLQSDPPHVVVEMLQALRQHVLADEKIPRDVKFRAFNTKTLTRLLALYAYKGGGGEAAERSVADAAHAFLLFAATDPVAGILRPCRGLYPRGTEEERKEENEESRPRAGIGSEARLLAPDLDGSFRPEEKYEDDVPVFNFVLSEFARKLRPWSGPKHAELLVSIFRAGPELISNYFVANKSFTFEPKLSMTWMGYAAFLFGTVRVPLPPFFGGARSSSYSRVPPPTSVLLDNLLPLPATQKVLVRCLSPDSPLTAFLAMRLLAVALEKLKEALEMHRAAARIHGSSSSSSSSWAAAGRRLVDEFCRRIPEMKDVVRSYKSIPEENILHRETASHVLLMYYEIMPRLALVPNLDVSRPVVASLQKAQSADPRDRPLCRTELENLISVASYSPGMRWFSKADGLPVSPFTALLRLLAGSSTTDRVSLLPKLRGVLEFVAAENQLVSKASGLGIILDPASAQDATGPLWPFLDNCVGRCSASPIKYHEMLRTFVGELSSEEGEGQIKEKEKEEEEEEEGGGGGGGGGGGDQEPVASLLSVTIADQLPYAVKSTPPADLEPVAEFLSAYLASSISAGESPALVGLLRKKMAATLPPRPGRHLSSEALRRRVSELGSRNPPDKPSLDGSGPSRDSKVRRSKARDTGAGAAPDEARLEEILGRPTLLSCEDATHLTKWSSKSVEDWVEEGYAAGLVRLLASPDPGVRKEALTNILKMAARTRESQYAEKDQVWLLLSEVAESSRSLVDAGPVPTCFPAFVSHAADVLRNPLHPLYPKVNRFLTMRPVWAPDRVPMVHEILDDAPSDDDRYYQELSWFLSYLLDGLASPADLAVFHARRLFERVLNLAGNPYLRAPLRTRILRLAYRATAIDGGSNTLATRFGVFGWLEAREAVVASESGGGGETDGRKDEGGEGEAAVCAALVRRVWETCDRARISQWSTRGVERQLRVR